MQKKKGDLLKSPFPFIRYAELLLQAVERERVAKRPARDGVVGSFAIFGVFEGLVGFVILAGNDIDVQIDCRSQGNAGITQVDGAFGVDADVMVAGLFVFSLRTVFGVCPFELYMGNEGSLDFSKVLPNVRGRILPFTWESPICITLIVLRS